jgi:ribonuclease-3
MLSAVYADADEGMLTRMRAALVNGETLAAWARRVDLGSCVAFGRGATLGSERERTNVLADAAEALIAAVYEARGLAGARALVSDIAHDLLEDAEALSVRDPKSALQESVQAAGQSAPTYRVVDVLGPPHEQTFVVEVVLGERALGRGEGTSKRLAERAAAMSALATLQERGSNAGSPDEDERPREGGEPGERK